MKNFLLRHLNKFLLLTISLFVFSPFFAVETHAQEVVDKTIVTVGDGVRTELITYSDLLWQLALQPNTPLAPPSSQDLNIALQVIINQKIFALEAQRLPRGTPTQDEIDDEIKKTLAYFPSTADFERRLKLVGFDSVKDDNFQRLIAQRVAIDKYIEFRFRSFAVITPDEENRYYREIFVPDFRKRFPGVLMPPLDEKRAEINQILMEDKVAGDIEDFLDDAKRRATIVTLSEV